MSLVFYNAPYSSATPVFSCIHELDIPHERVDLDIAKRETRTAAHLARNPNGKVPTLMVDGAPIFEGLAIMQWLGDRYGVERGLWPAAGTPERLAALSWTTWSYVTFNAPLRLLYLATSDATPQELHHEALAAFAREGLATELAVLDGLLAKKKFILGDAYSLADLVVGSVVLFARSVGAPVDEHPHVKAWADVVAARPAVRAAWQP